MKNNMNAPPTRPPYLFFSPRCPHSNHLIELIKKNQQLSKVIEPINVHTARALPPQLDGVPAILFRGQLLVGPDTFKWVQFQTPQDKRPQQQGHPSTAGNQGQMGSEGPEAGGLDGIPLPADISGHTKTGIDFTPLPGKQESSTDTTIPRFTFLPGQGGQSDGTVGIDVTAAMEDTGERSRSSGMAQQFEQLQKLRGADQDALNQSMGGGPYGQQQQNSWQGGQQGGGQQGGYMQGGGPYGQQGGQQQGGQQQGGQQGGYMQGGQQQGGQQQAPQQAGYMQGGPPPQQANYMQQQAPAQQGGGGFAEGGGPWNQGTQPSGGYANQQPTGYGNAHEQQQNPYGGDNGLPKRY